MRAVATRASRSSLRGDWFATGGRCRAAPCCISLSGRALAAVIGRRQAGCRYPGGTAVFSARSISINMAHERRRSCSRQIVVFFVALAADYDGTLARDGVVDSATVDALNEAKRSGRKLLMVTGRELSELAGAFPELGLFDLVIAENGALLFDPAKQQETLLAEPPPPAFIERLQELGVVRLPGGDDAADRARGHSRVWSGTAHYFQQGRRNGAAEQRQQGVGP